ncbi:hypothetical protein F5144DRAFT_255614 [Chaetomium tenue]|uniref:Uncharacterized protein n=1 Tax=Chaetomium tenue TaxID=1854479 RepID=A0ACB7P8D9_9PEZI|nr:hypothetical protein F5144DRAFT_255614 [Chaetomium globosum]
MPLKRRNGRHWGPLNERGYGGSVLYAVGDESWVTGAGCVFRIPLFLLFPRLRVSLPRCLLLAGTVYGLLDCEQYCVDIVFMYTDDSYGMGIKTGVSMIIMPIHRAKVVRHRTPRHPLRTWCCGSLRQDRRAGENWRIGESGWSNYSYFSMNPSPFRRLAGLLGSWGEAQRRSPYSLT